MFVAYPTVLASVTDSDGAPVHVSYGPPGVYQPGICVGIMATRQPIQRPTMSPQRRREKGAAEIDLILSVFVPGADVAAQVAAEQCDDLAELIDAYHRTSPNETLGGACRDSWLSNIAGPRISLAIDPKTRGVAGRVAESTATVTAIIRY